MRGDVIVVAVGLVVALAFSNLVKAFTDNIINRHKAPRRALGWAGRWSAAAAMPHISTSVHSSPRSFTSSSLWPSCISRSSFPTIRYGATR